MTTTDNWPVLIIDDEQDIREVTAMTLMDGGFIVETAIRALQLDASDFITKPIHTEAMMVALERARHRYRTRRQLKDYTRQLEIGLSRTSRELEETVAYQARLIKSAMDGILGCDGDGRVITFNRSMERMLKIDCVILSGWSCGKACQVKEAAVLGGYTEPTIRPFEYQSVFDEQLPLG